MSDVRRIEEALTKAFRDRGYEIHPEVCGYFSVITEQQKNYPHKIIKKIDLAEMAKDIERELCLDTLTT